MKLGEICEIIVFPDYAYYDSQTRRYEIELVDFYGSYNCCGPNSPILISCTKEGNRNVSPLPGEKVTVHLEAYCNDELFDCRDESFIMGDFDGSRLPEGLCKKLFSCNDGGEYRFKVTKPMLVTPMECEKRGIPEDAILWYNVIIKTCELRERPNRSASSKENMAALLSMKKRANEFFKAGKYKLADYMYSSIECLGFHNCDREDYQYIRSTTYQNRALCLLKLNLPNECIRACDWALKKDPRDEKCLFRRGLAYIMKNDYNEAEKCFKKVLEVNAENVEAETKLKLCKELLSKEGTREKGIFNCAMEQLGDVS
uniref:peptidylprolyl isomerase n=1 Tax=Echinococcus granulosus TaxID=6210 RepID=A0A068WYC7_ECHGR|nr:peptidyl prolyl cis trans isomerase FKBP4 [Echinococcus granulosus]